MEYAVAGAVIMMIGMFVGWASAMFAIKLYKEK